MGSKYLAYISSIRIMNNNRTIISENSKIGTYQYLSTGETVEQRMLK
jgi:hypothetical protein